MPDHSNPFDAGALSDVSTPDLMSLFEATRVELSNRREITAVYWTREGQEHRFEHLCKTLELKDMESHRANFCRFALAEVETAMRQELQRNNLAQNRLRHWLRKHAGQPAVEMVGDDNPNAFFASLAVKPASEL